MKKIKFSFTVSIDASKFERFKKMGVPLILGWLQNIINSWISDMPSLEGNVTINEVEEVE